MCAIIWSSFTWEAFATLATGMAAVIGAVYVARNQVNIISRQVELQYVSLKHDLYDRRMATYQVIENYAMGALGCMDKEALEKKSGEFITALRESQFLFPKHVYAAFKEVDGAITFCKNIMSLGESPRLSQEDAEILPEELNRARMRILGLVAQFADLLAPYLSLTSKVENSHKLQANGTA